jgi:electron transfer flavoprotein alpha subunit
MPGVILVSSEQPSLALELLGQARRLADGVGSEVRLCVSGRLDAADLAIYASYGADLVYATDQPVSDPCEWADILTGVIAESLPVLLLVGATKTGMEVAPRVAERCDASYAAWAVGIEIEAGFTTTTASCMLYAGTGLATYRFSRPVTILSVAPGVFEVFAQEGRVARVEPVAVSERPPRLSVLGDRAKSSSGARLQGARVVIDVGRGVKNQGDLELIRTLASLLDGQLSCSRPVSSDRDWFGEWLGLSGVKIKPDLCLTIGISGAVQHVVGIRDSRVIASVNNDENAAIFTQADIGVVADLNEFVPVLIERLKSRGAHPAWL